MRKDLADTAKCMGEQHNENVLHEIQHERTESLSAVRRHNICCRAGWEWDRLDRSKEILLYESHGLTSVVFHPHWSNGTAGIRASRPLIGAYNYWEIHLGERVFGTSLMFGVSTKKARVHANEFKNLLGEDKNGWGLSHRGRVHHDGESTIFCKPFQEYTPTVIGVLLDRVRGEISYFKDGVSLGVAFTGLDKVTDDLYPTLTSTAAKTVMSVGHRQRSFTDLQDRCMEAVISSICKAGCKKGEEWEKVDRLPLPKTVKRYMWQNMENLRVDPLL